MKGAPRRPAGSRTVDPHVMTAPVPERISALLVKFRHGLCRACLMRWSGESPEDVELALADLARAVLLTSEERPCPGCHQTATVVRFAAAD